MFAGSQSMTVRMSATATARSASWALASRLTRFPILAWSRLVGVEVVSDSLERMAVRWSITVTASEDRPVSFFPSSPVGRFPLAGSSPVGREG